MRYVTEADASRHKVKLDACGSIHKSGSVRGMQLKYGWPKGGQVKVGAYVYNIGVGEVDRLRGAGVLKGEAR